MIFFYMPCVKADRVVYKHNMIYHFFCTRFTGCRAKQLQQRHCGWLDSRRSGFSVGSTGYYLSCVGVSVTDEATLLSPTDKLIWFRFLCLSVHSCFCLNQFIVATFWCTYRKRHCYNLEIPIRYESLAYLFVDLVQFWDPQRISNITSWFKRGYSMGVGRKCFKSGKLHFKFPDGGKTAIFGT